MSTNTSHREKTLIPGLHLAQTIRERFPGIERQRGRIWTLIWVAMGVALAYFLLPEMEGLQASLRSLEAAQPGWLLVGAGLVMLRYVASAFSLRFAVGQPLPFGPTLLVQVSAAFIGRLTPEGVGWLVLNQRYLERLGIERVAALAGISLKVVAGVLLRLVFTMTVAAMVGASGLFQPQVPLSWPFLLSITVGVALLAFLAQRWFWSRMSRVTARITSGTRDLRSIFRQPWRAAGLLGTSAVFPLAYGLCLTVSILAFGVEVTPLEVFAVYLGATAVAAASPTPGNLGAVEVALSAGLTAIGIPSGPAVAAVLVYRLLTFWLPLLPGFIAFRYLQAQNHI
jgi:glycosyltransferase 2 family protein